MLRNLKNPPDLIKRIADAIIILKGFGPLSPVQMVIVGDKKQVTNMNDKLMQPPHIPHSLRTLGPLPKQ